MSNLLDTKIMTTPDVCVRVSTFIGMYLRLKKNLFNAVRYVIYALLIFSQGCANTQSSVNRVSNEAGNALLCRPEGNTPFPAVIYNHGALLDRDGYSAAIRRGIDLAGICEALANDGFLAYVPIRTSGIGNIPGHAQEVSQAIDFVKKLPEVDPSRIAVMGLSRGGLLTLMVGVKRQDLKSLVILAPAPGRGRFELAVQRVPALNAPVLLLVEASDDYFILQNFALLKEALQEHGKESRTILYDRGGGHDLFFSVDYYWEDVQTFLHETLKEAIPFGIEDQLTESEQTTPPAATEPSVATPSTGLVGPRGLTAAQVISNHDQNGDAKLSRDEFPGPPPAFALIDTDGDRLLTRMELEEFWRIRGFGSAED